MKKIVSVLFILGMFVVLIPLHIEKRRLILKREEYKKAIIKTRKNNEELIKKRDKLKKADYDTIREEATKLGLIKKDEKIIRFYPPK